MRINIGRFGNEFTIVSMAAENQAELFQLHELMERADKAKSDWFQYDNCEGDKGISFRVRNSPES